MGPYFYNSEFYFYDSTFPVNYRYQRETKTSTLVTFSGMTRLSRSTYLMTENWINGSDELENVYSFGVRFANSTFSFDIALAYLSNYEGFLPYLGLSYKF